MEKIILEIGPVVGNQIMFPTPLIITTEWCNPWRTSQ
jgi:hypothetical protein